MTHLRMLTFMLAFAPFLCAQDWEPLFNGTDPNGWTARPGGTWTVEEGTIVGRSPNTERRHGILLSDKSYKDFELRASFRVLKGDSGFYFRSEKVDTAVSVNGFQVEIDTTQETGGLYETGGRAWVAKPTEDAVTKRSYKSGEWTKLRLRAKGRQIQVYINDVLSAQLDDDPGRLEGHFGLQLHGRQDMHVVFKDLTIRKL